MPPLNFGTSLQSYLKLTCKKMCIFYPEIVENSVFVPYKIQNMPKQIGHNRKIML